ncbi:hypothetical protein M5689_010633 [Euphorbia peplus]|nr:hypothetical protein M5689_010633 [Euphorbia peplus]
MGNSLKISPCLKISSCSSSSSSSNVKLIFYEGTTTTLTLSGKKKHMIAGEIMFQNPDKILCDSDSFFIGQPLPSLSIDHKISPDHTYFLLPIDKFSPNCVLSASNLSNFSNSPIKFGNNCPFQHIKADNGRVLIRVSPEFIIGLIMNNNGKENDLISANDVCNTPELKKHYDQLVRSKDHTWSPKLHTISEKKIRYSPCRLLNNFEWKQKEN